MSSMGFVMVTAPQAARPPAMKPPTLLIVFFGAGAGVAGAGGGVKPTLAATDSSFVDILCVACSACVYVRTSERRALLIYQKRTSNRSMRIQRCDEVKREGRKEKKKERKKKKRVKKKRAWRKRAFLSGGTKFLGGLGGFG